MKKLQKKVNPNERVIICPMCNKPAKNGLEADSIQQIGECASCDHVRGSIEHDIRMEVQYEA